MNVLLVSISFTVIFFVWNVSSTNKYDGDRFGNDGNKIHDPMSFVSEEFWILEGVKCRAGFYNLTDELVDAVYHCAKLEHTKISRRRFSNEKVVLTGDTPFLCMRSCVIHQVGLTNEDRRGINETVVFDIFRKQMAKPGGEMSAFKLTKELMDCDKKYPTLFPSTFQNCSDTGDFFRCTKRVMLDCSDKKDKFQNEFMEYLANKRKTEINDEDYPMDNAN